MLTEKAHETTFAVIGGAVLALGAALSASAAEVGNSPEEVGEPTGGIQVQAEASADTPQSGDVVESGSVDAGTEAIAPQSFSILAAPLAKGWQIDGGAWRYGDGNGSYLRDQWLLDGGKWYYLGAEGVMKTGWLLLDGTWYFLNGSGAMQSGWLKQGATWYYLQPSGAMVTGWANLGGAWYFMGASGAMRTGWLLDGNKWYYLQPSGAMATGWANLGGVWYFLAGSGAMHTGWLQQGSSWYYLNASGAMASGQSLVDGKMTAFSSSGVWLGGVVDTAYRYLGVPYRAGGSSPAGFDCSGFTSYVYRQHGISVGASSYAQARAGYAVSMASAQPGDLLIMNGASHVGIYIGGGQMIHSPKPGRTVEVSSISYFSVDSVRRV